MERERERERERASEREKMSEREREKGRRTHNQSDMALTGCWIKYAWRRTWSDARMVMFSNIMPSEVGVCTTDLDDSGTFGK